MFPLRLYRTMSQPAPFFCCLFGVDITQKVFGKRPSKASHSLPSVFSKFLCKAQSLDLFGVLHIPGQMVFDMFHLHPVSRKPAHQAIIKTNIIIMPFSGDWFQVEVFSNKKQRIDFQLEWFRILLTTWTCNLKVVAISVVTWRTALHVPGTPFGRGSLGGYTITLT